ncbi:MAG: helix-turn-helix transcriptional regulator [Gemmatimonadaceae bacterium]
MSDAASQLRRILALVPELADDGEHPIAALAARLGTDRETLLADLRSLTERFDDPAGFVDEGIALFVERERVSLASHQFRRPMRLTAAELCALELGLAMLEGERPPEERSAIGRARVRLRAAMVKLAAHDGDADVLRHATLGAAGSAEHLAALRAALRSGRKLSLRYRRGDASEATARVVRPYALVVASGAWYVVAFCERSDDVRVFRLDRVEGAELLGEPFAVPASFSLDAVIRGGRVLAGEPARTMTVRYSPRIARWIAEREGRALDADGSLTVEHPLLDVQWGVRHALQYGPDAEVLGPAAVREELARRLRAMAGGGSAETVSRENA